MPADSPLVLVLYGSHQQRMFTHSSFAVEAHAMLDGVRTVKELVVIHALVNFGDEYRQAPVDVYTEEISLYHRLDADGVVHPKEVVGAVQELREPYHGGIMSTVTWLRAHGQLADALIKPERDTSLHQTIHTGAYGVRLAATDYLARRSSAAPDRDGVNEQQNYYDANTATPGNDCADDDDIANNDDDTGGTGMGK